MIPFVIGRSRVCTHCEKRVEAIAVVIDTETGMGTYACAVHAREQAALGAEVTPLELYWASIDLLGAIPDIIAEGREAKRTVECLQGRPL